MRSIMPVLTLISAMSGSQMLGVGWREGGWGFGVWGLGFEVCNECSMPRTDLNSSEYVARSHTRYVRVEALYLQTHLIPKTRYNDVGAHT